VRAPESKTNLDLLEQETVSGSGISWAICKSAPHPVSRQITMPITISCQHPTIQFLHTGRVPFLPPDQQRQSTEGAYSILEKEKYIH